MKNLFTKSLAYVLCLMLFAAMTLSIGCGKKTDTPVSTETSVSASTEASVAKTEEASVETSVEASVETTETQETTVESTTEENAMPVLEGCELGEGETQFTFEVTGRDGNTETFTINTSETTVGAALLAVNLIAGDESEYGLYVKTVNGELADWNIDQKYWAFYIDGEYAMTGVDTTEVTAGSTYTFKVE